MSAEPPSELDRAIRARMSSDAALEPFGDGVDNRAYLLEGRWVVRHARDRRAAAFLTREHGCLPWLQHLPVAIPSPVAWGEADGLPFMVHRLLPGASAETVVPSPALGTALGRFVAALHDTELELDAPPLPGVGKTDFVRARQQLVRWGHPETARLTDALVPSTERVWVHGDLYPRHVRLAANGTVSAIIDWGDVHRGDPALDVAIAFGWMPLDTRDAFFAAYGELDPEARRRARFYARYYAAAFEMLGRTRDDPGMAALAETYRRRLCGA